MGFAASCGWHYWRCYQRAALWTVINGDKLAPNPATDAIEIERDYGGLHGVHSIETWSNDPEGSSDFICLGFVPDTSYG